MNLEKKFFSKIQLSPTYALWNEPQIYSLNNCILDRNSFRIHVCFKSSVSWKRNKYIRYLKACSRAESSQTGQIGFTSPLSDDLYVYIPVNVSALIGILCLVAFHKINWSALIMLTAQTRMIDNNLVLLLKRTGVLDVKKNNWLSHISD